MAGEKYISVGKIGRPHGLSGAFRFFLDRELKSKKKMPGHFMLNLKGNFMPWFIKTIEWTGFNEGYILFEEVTSPEKGKQYAGAELCLVEKEVKTYFRSDAQSIDYLVGYNAISEAEGELGIIDDAIENPGQVLLVINRNGKELLIPFVEEFIVKLDKRRKEIYLSLPEGLVSSQL